MKSKLLLSLSLTLLLFTQLLTAQTWNTLGTAQFANDPKYIASAVNETSGNLYVAYVDQTDNDHLKVKYFDGSNWLDLGGNVSVVGNVIYPSIRINPITNEVWVAYRTNISPSNRFLMVKRFDGSSWNIEGQDIAANPSLPSQKIILRFSPSGDAYIAYSFVNSNGRFALVTSNKSGSWAFETDTGFDAIPDYGFDYPSYDILYFLNENSTSFNTNVIRRIYNQNNGTWNNPTFFYQGVYPVQDYQGLAATVINSRVATHNFNSGNDIDISTFLQSGIAPSNSSLTDGKSLQMKVNTVDGLTYLLYVKTTGEVVLTKFDETTWTDVSGLNVNIGSTSGETALNVKLSIRDTDGRIFVTYKDGSSITTKYIDVTPAATRFYVDQNATGNNDGTSWADAYTSFHDGLNAIENDIVADTLWVAQGTYKPDSSSRLESFRILGDNNKVFGGFNGTETDLDQRDTEANPTIISGDLAGNDDPNDFTYGSFLRLDNSYRLVSVGADNVELNGFILKDGHADGNTNSTDRGAAIFKFTQFGNFTIKNCVIRDNIANREGTLHLPHDNEANLTIESCQFINNLSRYGAGFAANQNSGSATLNIVVNNSLFYNNVSADIDGGSALSSSSFGIYLNNGGAANVTITNNTFSNNYDLGTNTTFDKGTVVLRRFTSSDVLNAEVHNNIFWNNFSDNSGTVNNQSIGKLNGMNLTSLNFTHNNSIQTNLASKALTFTESNNLNTDPLFEDEVNFDFSLQASSPMIDAGDNSQVPAGVSVDLSGNNRIINSTVDIGAYEYATLSNSDFEVQINNFSIYPNPANDFINVESKSSEIKSILIFDMTGRKIKTTDKKRININDLSKGIYLMKINTTQPNTSRTLKFIKQ